MNRAGTQANLDICDEGVFRRYREHRPGPGLRAFVECFWTQEIRCPSMTRPTASLRVLPDGCMDFVFRSDRGETSHGARLVGAMTRPLLVALHSPASFVGVRFRPGGAFPFLGKLSAGELTDAQLPLTEIWRHDEAERLADGLFRPGTGSPAEEVARMERALLARLGGGRLLSMAPWLGQAVAILQAQAGEVRIGTLCARLGLSRQHLARVFRAQVGLSPKQLARIFRLRRVLRRVRQERQLGREVNWSALAFDFGYCDQAHLSADCRELTGWSPGRHLGPSESDHEWIA